MYKDIFTSINLSPNESAIYEFLLKNGESSAGFIIKNTPLKRGLVYKVLDSLVGKGLVLEIKSMPSKKQGRPKISHFAPNHPEKLHEFIEIERKKLDKAKNTLEANMPAIISDFNLVSGKPGVRFYEGLAGIKEVLSDSLQAKETIYSYADLEAVVSHIDKINKEYVEKRDSLNIQKKVIFIDSPFARSYLKNYHRDTTFMRFIDHKLYPFNSVMQIYDGKVSYITLSEKNKIGVLIEDRNIYQLHKSIFEYTWSKAEAWI